MRALIVLSLLFGACKKDTPPPEPQMADEPSRAVAEASKAPPAVESPEPEKAPVEEKVVSPEPEMAATDLMEPGCEVEAFVIDPDPAGLNVRDEPSAKGEIAGGIPFNELGTVVTIVGSRNGWLQITGVEPTDEEPFEIDGWVSGQMVGTSLRCPDENPGPDCTVTLRSEPVASGALVRKLPLEGVVRVVGCKGKWLEVQTMESVKTQRVKGWLQPEAQCPNPVTSCS